MKSNKLESLNTALERARSIRADIAAHQDFQPGWEAREKQLLAAADLNDDKALVELGKVRLRLGLLPGKIAIFEEDYTRAIDLVRAEIRQGYAVYNPLASAREEELRMAVESQLAPLYVSSPDELPAAVQQALNASPLQAELNRLSLTHERSVFAHESLETEGVEELAARMLQNLDKLQALNIPRPAEVKGS